MISQGTSRQSVSPSVGHHPALQEYFTPHHCKAEKQQYRQGYILQGLNSKWSHNVLDLCQRYYCGTYGAIIYSVTSLKHSDDIYCRFPVLAGEMVELQAFILLCFVSFKLKHKSKGQLLNRVNVRNWYYLNRLNKKIKIL